MTQTKTLIARKLAKIAVRSLYFELKAYPKPGLVSFIDSGAHDDMNGQTFYRSLFSLRHYFYQISHEGLRTNVFDDLKRIAIDAEQRMLVKTQGVNTHRGAIFSLGLVCVSAARLTETHNYFTPADLHLQLVQDWALLLQHHKGDPASHGAMVREKYPVVDAKQMAIGGYKLVFQLLPAFRALFLETGSLDISCLFAYLELLVNIDDTNVLHRKGPLHLEGAKKQAAQLLAIPCVKARQEQALTVHHVFSQAGVSPGGVADLMGVLLFIGQLFCEPLRCHS